MHIVVGGIIHRAVRCFILGACFLLLSPCYGIADEQQPNFTLKTYRVGAGDKVSIRVFDEEELSREQTISGAGTISYPFLGELKVSGLTLTEIEDLIIRGLKGPYLIDPKVNISILQYRPFYINGEVKQSGSYPYQPDLTLRRAVALAGGFTERASQTKISVVRGEQDKKKQSLKIGLDDVVLPGDTITVEQSFF